MRKNRKLHQIVLLALAFIVLVYVLALLISNKKFAASEQNLETQIAEQQKLLKSLAEITGRNGADSVADSIIKDCAIAERTEFDTLLSRLDQGLPKDDLYKLERLFGRCGTFYSERKSLLAARLNREVEVYAIFVTQLDTLNSRSKANEHKVEEWKTLADLEQKQGGFFVELVSLQNEIVQALIADNAPDSQKMKEILTRVKTTQESLATTSNEIAKLQTSLNS